MKITDKMIADVISDLVILTDTREQKNKHILDYFDEKEIKHQLQKLDTGDYSFILPNYQNLGMDNSIIIEKKNSLDEIAGNFTKDRLRFVEEFERVGDSKIHLLIENATWKKVVNASYRSQLPAQNMIANLFTWNIRYNCPIWFANPTESGMIIYQIIKYEVMEKLKKIRLDNLNQ